ncbi:hypothetical protein H4V95_002046 [Arthrobacter sp. CAN_C5]|nr:hypothetical protein [Arthrobacter sp. CAN_C5]
MAVEIVAPAGADECVADFPRVPRGAPQQRSVGDEAATDPARTAVEVDNIPLACASSEDELGFRRQGSVFGRVAYVAGRLAHGW